MPLDSPFNALPQLWMHPEYADACTALGREAEVAWVSPAVTHFAGSGIAKPWHHHCTHRCTHPWRQRYLKIRQRTPWMSLPLKGIPTLSLGDRLGSLRFRIKRAGKQIPNKLNP